MTGAGQVVRRGAAAAVVASLAIGGAVESSASAVAPLKATFTANVTTTVVKPNPDKTIKLAPAKLTTYLVNTADGAKLTNGTLPLKPVTTTMPLNLGGINLVDVKATITFIPQGKVTGRMIVGNKIRVSATAKDYVKISNVSILGGVPIDVGNDCKTATPVTLRLATGTKGFNLEKGGTLSGTYTIPNFANCKMFNLIPMSPLLSSQLSGPGNKITVHLSNGHLG